MNEDLDLKVTDFAQRQTDDHYLLIKESHKVQDLELTTVKLGTEIFANTEAVKSKVETDHFIEELEYFRSAGVAKARRSSMSCGSANEYLDPTNAGSA